MAAFTILNGAPQRIMEAGKPQYQFIFNANAPGGATVWLSDTVTAPGPNVAGCWSLAPGQNQEFGVTQGFVPPGPLYAGTDGTGPVALTVRVF